MTRAYRNHYGCPQFREAWAVRYWRWNDGVDRSEDADPDTQSTEIFRRYPTRAMAVKCGAKLAADPNNMSPGMFDVMHGTPDEFSQDGWSWAVDEEVRP